MKTDRKDFGLAECQSCGDGWGVHDHFIFGPMCEDCWRSRDDEYRSEKPSRSKTVADDALFMVDEDIPF